MESVKINTTPKGARSICYASQYDNGRIVRFELFSELLPYKLDGSETIKIKVVRPDNVEIIEAVTNTEDYYIDVNISSDMTALAGVASCELEIKKGETVIGSRNFDMNIESDSYGSDISIGEAQGIIATFETDIIDNLVSLKTTFEPKQDLHGFDRPWPAGAGNNLLKLNDGNYSINGVSIVIENGKITANGTATQGGGRLTKLSDNFILKPNTYYINGYVSVSGLYPFINKASDNQPINTGDARAFIIEEETEVYFGINLTSSQTYTNVTATPMVNVGNASMPYEPYENICEIEGIDEINFSHTGVNLWGGEKMADAFVNARTYSKDTSSKTFTFDVYPTSPYSETILKGCFKPNTQYTFILRYTAANDNNSLRIIYSDGTELAFNLSTANTKTDYILTSAIGKTIKEISLTYYLAGLVTVYYDESGLFEGVKTIDEYHAYDGESALVEIGQEVYGGYYDNNLGIVLTWIGIDLGALSWFKGGSYNNLFYAAPENEAKRPINDNTVGDIKSENYPSLAYNSLNIDDNITCGISLRAADAVPTIRIKDPKYQSASEANFKAAMSGKFAVYGLKDPIIIPAEKVNLTTVKGVNNVWSDTNGETEVKFFVKES